MKTLYSKKIKNLLLVFSATVFLFAGGCYTISYIIQPDIVSPNSAYNIKMCVKLSGGWETADYFPSYGILGILLPEGWTVKDSIKWDMGQNNQNGFFCYSGDIAFSLKKLIGEPPSGYYWWGAKSFNQLNIAQLDAGFINLTILTDEKIGEFNTQFFLGDELDWNKKNANDPFGIVDSSEIMPIIVDVIQHAAHFGENEEWKIYPNPSDGKVCISRENFSHNTMMNIYNLNGQLQKSTLLCESRNTIDLSNLSKGEYIITLENGGEISTKKLILK